MIVIDKSEWKEMFRRDIKEKLLEQRKEFSKIRIQKIDYSNQNIKELFIRGING
jgi:biotin synthase-related radical SAM superfamily protein